MRGFILHKILVLVLAFAVCLPVQARENWRAEFRENLIRAAGHLSQGAVLPSQEIPPNADFYLLVSGFLTDFTPGTFEGTLNHLNQGGDSQLRAQVFTPNSMDSFELSAEKLMEHLDQVVKREPARPLVLTGHSRGAVVLWITMMKNPQFFIEHVKRIVFLQGAFGGSVLAESVNTLRAGLEATSWSTADLLRSGTSLVTGLFEQYLSSPLTPKAASKSVREIIRDYSRQLPQELHDRMVFVATTYNMLHELANKPIAAHDPLMVACAVYTAWQSPQLRSDGVLHINDQAPPCARDNEKIVVEGFHHNGLTSGVGATALGYALQTL